MTRKPTEIEADVARLAHLNDQLKALSGEADSIKGRLRADYATELGTHLIGDHKVSITSNRRFDETTARAVLPANIIEACTVTSLSSANVKRAVAPALYELCTIEGELRVAVS